MTKEDRFFTDDEIVDNDKMYTATANIESLFITPTMLIQVFALFAVIFRISTPAFCVFSFALYAFGCVWRCSNNDPIFGTLLLFLSTLYNMLWWLCYVALIVLTFTLGSTYLILPYIVTRIVCFVFELLQNHFILNYTHKKYGVPFNDTEICAFRVFQVLSGETGKFSDYINAYVSAVNNEKEPSIEQTEATTYQQLTIFDAFNDDARD